MTKVEELRKGIVQRLNNPEGLQEEEVDSLILAAYAEGAKQMRETIWKAILTAQFDSPVFTPKDEPECDELPDPPDPMEEIANKYF